MSKRQRLASRACTSVQRARKAYTKVKEASVESPLSPVKHRLRSKSAPPCAINARHSVLPACLFCDDFQGDLHKAETFGLDTKVRQMAIDLWDTKLVEKLSAGDMVAIDSVYHKNCLTTFYNHHWSLVRRRRSNNTRDMNPEALALAKVVSYIEE